MKTETTTTTATTTTTETRAFYTALDTVVTAASKAVSMGNADRIEDGDGDIITLHGEGRVIIFEEGEGVEVRFTHPTFTSRKPSRSDKFHVMEQSGIFRPLANFERFAKLEGKEIVFRVGAEYNEFLLAAEQEKQTVAAPTAKKSAETKPADVTETPENPEPAPELIGVEDFFKHFDAFEVRELPVERAEAYSQYINLYDCKRCNDILYTIAECGADLKDFNGFISGTSITDPKNAAIIEVALSIGKKVTALQPLFLKERLEGGENLKAVLLSCEYKATENTLRSRAGKAEIAPKTFTTYIPVNTVVNVPEWDTVINGITAVKMISRKGLEDPTKQRGFISNKELKKKCSLLTGFFGIGNEYGKPYFFPKQVVNLLGDYFVTLFGKTSDKMGLKEKKQGDKDLFLTKALIFIATGRPFTVTEMKKD